MNKLTRSSVVALVALIGVLQVGTASADSPVMVRKTPSGIAYHYAHVPGETRQDLHTDDSFYRVARPRAALGVSAIWAIDDFTGDNGATQVVTGSHRWGDEVPVPSGREQVGNIA